MKRNISAYQLSSLAKVFPTEIHGDTLDHTECAVGQHTAYQIAIMGDAGEYSFNISTAFEGVAVYRVGYVPSAMPAYPQAHDDDYITVEPGLFPDPLIPVAERKIILKDKEYLTLWIDLDANCGAGVYPIEFTLMSEGDTVFSSFFELTVHSNILPKQKIRFTQWFHTDCIADVHGVEVFSPEHWRLIEKYIKIGAQNGLNMLLVPVLTPPLDTEVGGERTTVQLAEIVKNDDTYDIDLSRLERFIDICVDAGIEYFEINHFFTQWGAKNAPKVIATVDGEKRRIFGWETDADSPEYKEFLCCLVPKIIATFEKKGIDRSRLYFHVSDEPSREHLDSYRVASSILLPLIDGCNHMDALSHFEFYGEGLVSTPVVGTNSLEPFIEAGVPDLWCYYCCAQAREVANRFFAMPSRRNRIIGVQMYKYNIAGFLHWGYNFYNTQYSKAKIDPFKVTDAGGAFPSGDSFSVYPYRDDVIPSLRLKVFKHALEDISLLKLLEDKIGRDEVIGLIDECAGIDITFKKYPTDDDFFTRLYKRVFEKLRDE